MTALGAIPTVHESRRSGVGASEVAGVLGVDPYRTDLDIWLEKTGRAEPFEGNEHTRWGNILEPVLRDELARAFGAKRVPQEEVRREYITRPAFQPDQITVVAEHLHLYATPDDVLEVGLRRIGAEVKNRGARQADRWGESGTDEIPDEVALQCHAGMVVLGLDVWVVGAYFGGSDFRTYRLQRDDAIADVILLGVNDFWARYMIPDAMPPITSGGERTHKTLASIFPRHVSDEILTADETATAALAMYFEARAERESWETTEDLRAAQLKAIIGERAGLVSSVGKISWKATKDIEGTDWKAAANTLGQIVGGEEFDKVVHQNTYTKPGHRVFRPTRAKEKAA